MNLSNEMTVVMAIGSSNIPNIRLDGRVMQTHWLTIHCNKLQAVKARKTCFGTHRKVYGCDQHYVQTSGPKKFLNKFVNSECCNSEQMIGFNKAFAYINY